MKLLLDRRESPLFDLLFGGPVEHWRNIEIPKVENKRSDLIAETAREVFYTEIDGQNDAELLPRTCRNYLALRDGFLPKVVTPVVFYIGRKPLTLPCPYVEGHVEFRYNLVDAHDVPGAPLLASPDIRDNILAILMDADREEVVETVLRKLRQFDPRRRDDLALQFTILGGLRGAARYIIERANKMITMQDLMENEVIGPWLQDKYEEGEKAGTARGVQEGECRLLRLMLENRFGPLSPTISRRLEQATEPELTQWAMRTPSARTIDEIFA